MGQDSTNWGAHVSTGILINCRPERGDRQALCCLQSRANRRLKRPMRCVNLREQKPQDVNGAWEAEVEEYL